MAKDEARSHVDFGPASFGLHLAASAAEAEVLLAHGPGQNHVSFVRGPDGRLRYGLTAKTGPGSTGVVVIGEAIETPWMGMTVTVSTSLLAARDASKHGSRPPTRPTGQGRRRKNHRP